MRPLCGCCYPIHWLVWGRAPGRRGKTSQVSTDIAISFPVVHSSGLQRSMSVGQCTGGGYALKGRNPTSTHPCDQFAEMRMNMMRQLTRNPAPARVLCVCCRLLRLPHRRRPSADVPLEPYCSSAPQQWVRSGPGSIYRVRLCVTGCNHVRFTEQHAPPH